MFSHEPTIIISQGRQQLVPPMASRFLFLLVLHLAILLALLPTPTRAGEHVLLGNRTLYAGQALYSRHRHYRLIMQSDCSLVLYEFQKPIWSSNAARQLVLPCDATLDAPTGRLVVRMRNSNRLMWSSTATSGPVNYVLVLQNDLNVVIYRTPLWSSNTALWDTDFSNGDQILMASRALRVGQFLSNNELNFRFIMQEDCDLVLYDDDRRIWSSETSGKGTGCYAKLHPGTGQLVIRDDRGMAVWISKNRTPQNKHVLLLQPDRNLVVYTGRVWASDTSIPEALTIPGGSGGPQNAETIQMVVSN